MTPEEHQVRTPARAAYEAYDLATRGDLATDIFTDWAEAPESERAIWANVANAAVFAALHCDSVHDGLPVGQKVVKTGGDYSFEGWIIAMLAKRSGAVRFVVEDERGLLLIMRPDQVRPTP